MKSKLQFSCLATDEIFFRGKQQIVAVPVTQKHTHTDTHTHMLGQLGCRWLQGLLAGYLERGKEAEFCIPARSKLTSRSSHPRATEELGSVLNNSPVSNHLPNSSHCLFSICFPSTVCQSTEAACCSATIASCSSIRGWKAVLVLGWENIVGCIGYWQMAISLFLSSYNAFSVRCFSQKMKTDHVL